jgi:hypothetical protein
MSWWSWGSKKEEQVEYVETWQQKWERENPAYEKLQKSLKELFVKEIYVSSAFFEMYINERLRDEKYIYDYNPLEVWRDALLSGERMVYGNKVVPQVKMIAKDWKPPVILESVDLSGEL